MANAYIIAELAVVDPVAYKASGYMAMAEASVAAHGGRFIVRGGSAILLEGEPAPGRIVVLEFPSLESAQLFYASEDYAPAIVLRQTLSTARLVLVDGYEP